MMKIKQRRYLMKSFAALSNAHTKGHQLDFGVRLHMVNERGYLMSKDNIGKGLIRLCLFRGVIAA
jgi:Zn-dependent membrane protease YugP